MFRKRRRKDTPAPAPKGKRAPTFDVESLEKRVLMSASWVDADTGDSQDGATNGNDQFDGSAAADIAAGGNGQDLLFGGAGDDVLSGDNHDDHLEGGAGNDILEGGQHQDVLIGGEGDDVIDGGKHDDTIIYTVGDGLDRIDGGQHNDTLQIMGVEGQPAAVLVEDAGTFEARTGASAEGHGVVVSINGDVAMLADNVESIGFTAANAEDSFEISGDLGHAGVTHATWTPTDGDGHAIFGGEDSNAADDIHSHDQSADHSADESRDESVDHSRDLSADASVDEAPADNDDAGPESEAEDDGIPEVALDPDSEPERVDLEAGLVLHLDFEEIGQRLEDQSAYDNDGSVGGELGQADGAAGDAGEFDGDDTIRVDSDASINKGIVPERTVSLWFKSGDSEGRQVLFEEGGSTRGVNIYLEDGQVVFGGWNKPNGESGWAGTYLNGGDVDDGQWHHVVLTLEGGDDVQDNAMKAYVDGELVGSGPGSKLWSHGDATGIGGVNGSSRFEDGATKADRFVGDMDEVRVYNRVVNDAEINALGEMGVQNAAPTGIAFESTHITENQAAAGIPIVVSDPDGETSFEFQVSDDRFEVVERDGGHALQLRDGITLDHEAEASVEVRVTATDEGGLSVEQAVTIEVGDVNESPFDLTIAGGSVSENAAVGTVVATASASDVDAGDTLSYSLSDDADGRFAIDPVTGEITVAGELDHESAESHTVTVVATDAEGLSVEQAVTIDVADVNESPFDLTIAGGSIPENAAVGTVVATASATDVDAGDTLTYSLSDDADGRFAIDPATGEITVAGELDHESAESHAVTVVATDAEGLSVEQEVTIDVADVNEAIESVAVFAADGTELTAGEPGSYGFEDLSPGDNPTSLTFDNGVTAQIEQANVRTSQIIERDDGHGAVSAEGSQFWKLTGGETTLHFDQPLQEFSFSYSDVEGGEVTVSVNGRTIDLERGNSNRNDTMTLTAEPGETIESVTFAWGNTNNDGVGFDAFTATPADPGGIEIAEDIAPGTVVASVAATDPDAGETFEYRLADDADGRLEIDETGTVRIAEGAQFDFETESEVRAEVEVTDSAGHTQTAEIVLSVSDANEAPFDLAIEGGSVSEDAPVGTLVATASASDADAGDTLNYSLSDDANGRFAIDSATGEITVAGGLDHESAATHEVTVVATDAEGLSAEQVLTITVGDVNEGPAVDAGAPIVAVEGEAVTLAVTASDQDGDALTYSWTQVGGPAVSLDDASAAEPAFTAPDIGEDTTLTFEVAVSDGEFTTTETVTVEVQANEAPTLYVDHVVTVREGEPVTLEVEARPAGQISFDDVSVDSHGGASQDVALDVAADGDTLHLEGNGWKSVDFPYAVTENTVLEFQFRSTAEGELHGIGFDTDGNLSPETTFKLMGTQGWGNQSYVGDATDDGEWVTYRITVGEHFTGDFDRLVFMNDHDVDSPTAVSEFRGVRVYEAGDSTGMDSDLTYEWRQTGGPAVTLDDPSSTTPTFEAPDIGQDETITFEVTVSDGHNSTTETVEVRVEANEAPVVEAGDDLIVDERAEVTLSASIETPAPQTLDFETADIDSHGGASQDVDLEVVASGDTLELSGNGWKAVPMDAEIGPDTVLEFQFRSDATGEIHGIGFDVDGGISPEHTFQLHGTQTWGIQAEHSYEGSEGEWVTYRIPVGEHFTGEFDRIVFVNDHDVADPDATSAFRGVRLTTAADDGSAAMDSDITYSWEQISGPEVSLSDANAANPTFEAPEVGEPTEVQFRVTASDGDNATSDIVSVTINPVNDAPFDLTIAGGSVSEDVPVGTVVATASASDADVGDTLSYSLSNDAGGLFSIDPTTGEITAAGELDHESAGTHELTVVATDAGGLSVEQSLTISVGDANESPFDLTIDGGSVSENAAVGTVVATASASDNDADEMLTYSLSDDAGGLFAIDPSTGEITTAGELDFEDAGSHEVTVVATDAGGLSVEQSLTISVGDANESPFDLTIDGGSVSEVAPVGTVVATASASDTDAGDTLTYSLSDDAGGLFAIDPTTGEITTAGELDFESSGSHEVTVVATDAGGLSVEQSLTISVGDANESPFDLTIDGGSVSEVAPIGTVVATASASDGDAGDTLTYSLSNDAGGLFAIDPTTGEITTAGELDFEGSGSHEVTVMATDAGGLSVEQPLTISVGDVNEGPFDLTIDGGSVSEVAPIGTVVATASASDSDAGDTLTYSLSDDAGGLFAIDPTTGEITVAGELDHESAGTHEVAVVATDAGGLTAERSLTITVGDVNEGPFDLTIDGGIVSEDAPVGTVVATASASENDAGDTLSYSLSDDAGGRFAIDPMTGEITVAGNLDHESAATHEVTVVATDAEGLSAEEALTISVGDVNEGPIFAPGAVESLSAAQGEAVSLEAGATDGDGDRLEYAWRQVGGPPVELTGTQSATLGFTAPNLDAAGELVFVVEVSDGERSVERTVRVAVAAGDAGFDREHRDGNADGLEPGSSDGPVSADAREATLYTADVGESDGLGAVEGDPAMGVGPDLDADAERVAGWVASEIAEMTELARSVEPDDLIPGSRGSIEAPEAEFGSIFSLEGPDAEGEPVARDTEPVEQSGASGGFLAKLVTMLRAGFGAHGRDDEHGVDGADQFKR